MSWTKERTSLLEKMWSEGKSAAEIAKQLGGITRNAVIGKAHRMGLSGRPSPIKNPAQKKTASKKDAMAIPAKTKPRSAPAAGAAKKQTDDEAELPKNIMPIPAAPRKPRKESSKKTGLSILDLTDRICKWPIGDPQEDDFHFCGTAVHPGRPYCVPHCTEAYQALQKKAAAAKKAALKAEEKAKAKAAHAAGDDEEDEDLEDIDDIDVDNIDVHDDDDDDDMVSVGD